MNVVKIEDTHLWRPWRFDRLPEITRWADSLYQVEWGKCCAAVDDGVAPDSKVYFTDEGRRYYGRFGVFIKDGMLLSEFRSNVNDVRFGDDLGCDNEFCSALDDPNTDRLIDLLQDREAARPQSKLPSNIIEMKQPA